MDKVGCLILVIVTNDLIQIVHVETCKWTYTMSLYKTGPRNT